MVSALMAESDLSGVENELRPALGTRIALGMSGGVDSAVAALLLQRAGFEVVGVTCLFQDNEAARAASRDAWAVCDHLGIEHVEAVCADHFECTVIQPFVEAYAQGLTPSPCIACNANCKLPALLEVADQLACEKVATGHYARIVQLSSSGRFAIKTGLDARKDQSYMLALLSQDQLSRLVLPLGGMTKAEVRVLASQHKLAVAEKPESQDVCFITGNYRDFLQSRGVADEPGEIIDTKGRVLGHHSGLSGFTLGQRRGIGVAAAQPLYVVEKRALTKQLVVGTAKEALIQAVVVADLNWQAFTHLDHSLDALVKLRYRSSGAACIIEPSKAKECFVQLRSAQATTAPGQYAVFYEGATVLGGGIIKEVLRA